VRSLRRAARRDPLVYFASRYRGLAGADPNP
jgi:hypothetical protein